MGELEVPSTKTYLGFLECGDSYNLVCPCGTLDAMCLWSY